MGKVIVISSGKGGVGKTTTSLNLAASLTKQGKDVILVDGNLTTPNVALHLGITSFPVTLNEVLKGEAPLDDAIYHHPLGFRLIPGNLSIRSFTEMNSRKLKKIFEDLREKADFVIVDSAAGLGNESVSVLKNADEVIIVTQPELPSLTDAFKVITLAREVGVPVKGIILNRVRRDNFDISLKAIESLLETPITGLIEEEPAMREAVYLKKPLVHLRPNSKTSRNFHNISKRIIDGNYERRLEELERENSFLITLLKKLGF